MPVLPGEAAHLINSVAKQNECTSYKHNRLSRCCDCHYYGDNEVVRSCEKSERPHPGVSGINQICFDFRLPRNT